MSKLIDAEDYEQALIANDWDKSDDEFFTGGIFELLHEAPTVQAIPLDKVKEARGEFISKYPKNYMGEPELGGRTCYFSLNDVLEILDKLIESEEIE